MNNILQVLLKFVSYIQIMLGEYSGGLFCNYKKKPAQVPAFIKYSGLLR
uniref:Uncharacterized protein n=1 Tax=Yersinia enterocolitica W22703 TaxID=913028 RepID=F4MWS9_YEREN|nr:unknown protein [Yersinia enterocolitica W22703]